jgi:imidazolonepropionase-like amidohydrolase
VIEAIGEAGSIEVPAGYRRIDATGLVAYPGLIDAAVRIPSADAAAAAALEAGAHWNGRVVPQIRADRLPPLDPQRRRSLRELGFTSAAVYPDSGVLRGSGAVWPLSDAPLRPRLERAMMAAAFERGGSWDRATYPGALVGSVALLRQTLLDARWHAECRERFAADPRAVEAPISAVSLEALAEVVAGRQALLLHSESEGTTLLAARVADELRIPIAVAASGLEFRRLAEVAAAGVPLVVPLDFPDAPSIDSPWQAQSVSLRDLLTWEQAPTNPKRLLEAGGTVAITTDRLRSLDLFPERMRRAIAGGLSHEEALAMLTTVPAELLGISEIVGSIAAGKQADLILVEGDLFARGSKIREVFIGGVRHETAPRAAFGLRGEAIATLPDGSSRRMRIDPDAPRIEVWPAAAAAAAADAPLEPRPPDAAPSDAEPEVEARDEPRGLQPKPIRARNVSVIGGTLSMRIAGSVFGQEGDLRVAGTLVGETLRVTAENERGERFRFTVAAAPREGDAEAPGEPASDGGDGEEDAIRFVGDWRAPLPVPLGAFGPLEAPRRERVLFRGATLWTCGPAGVVEDGDLLVEEGRIVYAGPRRAWPWESGAGGEAPRLEDRPGRHITPGLIDCHSHTGLVGGVNEWTRNCTAEVRMRDAMDPDDVNWYRQLAGGLTVANQLHGSANPIGGQNHVVKLRWGSPTADHTLEDATPGIKFALGENVVRPRGRYPQTRMGVEAFIEDRFEDARRHRREQLRHAALPPEERSRAMPPRPDLQLDALAEILAGERLVHCHSYRQDEILMLLRLAERQGFTVGTLQHVLEGYKVAAEIAAHGAAASSFSDWWGFKMEVMDAVPDNGAILDRAGVVTSFNSDSNEHARRMNTEAAKAVRHGGLPPERALALVAINPAKQLGVDHRIGSLEAGKDADFAIWSAPPLSGLAVCEETWVDGARHFSLAEDAALAERDAAERHRLMAKASSKRRPSGRGAPPEAAAEGAAPVVRSRGLLGSMHLARERQMLELVRQGLDPMQSMPGACGTDWLGDSMEERR